MQHHNHFAPVTVVHDFLLLTAPRLDSAALTCVPTGTELQPLAYQQGFFTVAYQQHQGFLPAAVCSPGAEGAAPLLRLERTYRLHPQYAAEPATVSLPLLPFGTSVQLLGRDHTWLLVQCRDGRLGFITREDTWTSAPVGCFTALSGYLLGFGWVMTNWIGLDWLIRSLFGQIPTWAVLINAALLIAGSIVLLIRSRSEFALVFSIGALTLGLIVSAFSVTLAS
jgi:hypothetical protein